MLKKVLPEDIIHTISTYVDIIDIIMICPQTSLLIHVAENVSEARRLIDESVMKIRARRMGITLNFSPLKDATSPTKIMQIAEECVKQWYSSSNRFQNSKKKRVFRARKKLYRQMIRCLLVSCLHDFSFLQVTKSRILEARKDLPRFGIRRSRNLNVV